MTKTTINKNYANLLEVTKVQGFAKLERKATFDFFKNITLAKSLLIGKHIAWYDDQGKEELANIHFQFDFSKTSDGIIDTAKAGKQTSLKASSEYVEFVHFAAHFYHIKKSDSYDARKVFKIEKKIVNQFLAQVQKEGNALPLKVSALIKFAKQLEKGVSAEEQNSDESEKKESKSEAKKAKVVIRNTVLKCQYTEGSDGKLNIQGSYEDNLKTLIKQVS